MLLSQILFALLQDKEEKLMHAVVSRAAFYGTSKVVTSQRKELEVCSAGEGTMLQENTELN